MSKMVNIIKKLQNCGKTKLTVIIHVLEVISSDGDITPLYFLQKGKTVTKDMCVWDLTTVLQLWKENVALEKDGALVHTNHLV